MTEPAWTAEELFIRWWLRHATVSNVELAHLSNVNRRWRQAAQHAIVAQATTAPERTHNGRNEKRSFLLLPSMVRLLHSQINGRPQSHDGAVTVAPVDTDTFCAAWFHPDGIQEERISLNGKMTTAEEEEDETTLGHSYHSSHNTPSTPFVPSGGDGQAYAYAISGDEDEVRSRGSRKEMQRDSQRSRSPAAAASLLPTRTWNGSSASDSVATCAEWRGHHSALQVLQPFGYSTSFVKEVFSFIAPQNETASAYLDEDCLLGTTNHTLPIRDPTFAVRGAVIARPESYCFCVDPDVERLKGLRSVAATGENGTDDYSAIRRHEYKQSLLRKERRRRELQRDVLPRILTRTTGPGNGNTTPKATRSVQFLNAAGSHAVCMMTPPFACGPLLEPVTILCVGIATEDGCFVSGLHQRFELGHLYPNDEVAEATELSPVCIATDCGGMDKHGIDGEVSLDTSGNTRTSYNGRLYSRNDEDDDDDDHDNDGDSSCDGSEDELASSVHQKCTCIFHGVSEKLSAMDEDEPRRIHRGRLGPGQWHCYVAVFDGDASLIRVDGLTEPEPVPSSSRTHATVDSSRSESSRGGPATLDGLTIGSDHTFAMSLCCGNGSGGEGEGAIAELAVFHGRLDLADVQVLEQELMLRHGIPTPLSHNDDAVTTSPNKTANEMVWRENEWARQAHALFFLPDLASTKKTKHKPPPSQIPLRFLARHRSVAWKQMNPVTGEPISVKRIGCKPGASSSDL